MEKKILNKLLENIDRGLRIAIDDYEDEEVGTLKEAKLSDIHNMLDIHKNLAVNDIIQKINESSKDPNYFYTTIWTLYSLGQPIDKDDFKYAKNCSDTELQILVDVINLKKIFERQYVDLNLPSETLWCTNNLGADDLIDLGNKYKWGMNEPKNDNSYDDPIVFSKKLQMLLSSKHEIELDMDIKDDPSYNLNVHYRIPTVANFLELKKFTNLINIFNGILLVSKKDPLNFLFFNLENALYLTRTVTNYNKYSNDILNSQDITSYFMKIYDGANIFRPFPFKSFAKNGQLTFKIPPVAGYIKPIYIK